VQEATPPESLHPDARRVGWLRVHSSFILRAYCADDIRLEVP
jgi:hypothetical protein